MVEKNNFQSKNMWEYCQENSDAILSSGIELLIESDKYKENSEFPSYSGNYLISLDNTPYYIGEAQVIKKRLKQQFKKNSSTFYKNYLRKMKNDYLAQIVNVEDFDVQVTKTLIGRKEMEEFGIVNLETSLNKVQLGKRNLYGGDIDKNNWIRIQNSYEEILFQGKEQFLDKQNDEWYNANIEDGPGIYYVENKELGLIYIGESTNIKDRHKTHSGDTRFSALRRHIATEILGYKLKTKKELGIKTKAIKDKRMCLSQDEDLKVNDFLKGCYIKTEIIRFGRYELEDYLIKTLKPLLNVKGNL